MGQPRSQAKRGKVKILNLTSQNKSEDGSEICATLGMGTRLFAIDFVVL
jgi:hypothetical protein